MPTSIETQYHNALLAWLATLTSTTALKVVALSDDVDITPKQQPGMHIVPQDERGGLENQTLNTVDVVQPVILDIWGTSYQNSFRPALAFKATVREKMEDWCSDATLSSLLVNLVFESSNHFAIGSQSPIWRLQLFYEATYRHLTGDPFNN